MIVNLPFVEVGRGKGTLDPGSSASFLAMLDRMHLTAIAGPEALSETRRRHALAEGLRHIRGVLLAQPDPGVLDEHPDLDGRDRRRRAQRTRLAEGLDAVIERIACGSPLPELVPSVVDLVATIRTYELDRRELESEGSEDR